MAALTQTAADVGVGNQTALTAVVQVGEAVTQGNPGYRLSSDGKYYKASNDDAAEDDVACIFLTAAATDGYAVIALPSRENQQTLVDLGATLTVGASYYLGPAGAIHLESDNGSGDFVTFIGIAETTALIDFDPKTSSTAKP